MLIKNPVYLREFSVPCVFWFFEAKGNWIVFRSHPSSYTPEGETKPRPSVDLILLGAIFIELETTLYGLKITRPRDQLSATYREKYDQGFNFSENEERVYAIESQGNRFHVITANLWIHIHKQRMGESPLNHFYDGDITKYNEYLDKYVEQ